MSLLDFFRYGLSPDVADFIYKQIPMFLLLTGGLFILLYLVLSLGGIAPQGPLAVALLMVSLSASFLLLTQSFSSWFVRNLGAVFFVSQGLSLAVVIIFIGLVLYLIFAK